MASSAYPNSSRCLLSLKSVHVLTATVWIQRGPNIDISHKYKCPLRLTFSHAHSCFEAMGNFQGRYFVSLMLFGHCSHLPDDTHSPLPTSPVTHSRHPVPSPSDTLGHPIAIIPKGFSVRPTLCSFLFDWKRFAPQGFAFALFVSLTCERSY